MSRSLPTYPGNSSLTLSPQSPLQTQRNQFSYSLGGIVNQYISQSEFSSVHLLLAFSLVSFVVARRWKCGKVKYR